MDFFEEMPVECISVPRRHERDALVVVVEGVSLSWQVARHGGNMVGVSSAFLSPHIACNPVDFLTSSRINVRRAPNPNQTKSAEYFMEHCTKMDPGPLDPSPNRCPRVPQSEFICWSLLAPSGIHNFNLRFVGLSCLTVLDVFCPRAEHKTTDFWRGEV